VSTLSSQVFVLFCVISQSHLVVSVSSLLESVCK
jgi:hypothetical protein